MTQTNYRRLPNLEISRLKERNNKFKILENKRNNELEGFLNELKLIRKRMTSYENYIHKLKQYTNVQNNVYNNNHIKSDIEHNQEGFNRGIENLRNDVKHLENSIKIVHKVIFEKSHIKNLFILFALLDNKVGLTAADTVRLNQLLSKCHHPGQCQHKQQNEDDAMIPAC